MSKLIECIHCGLEFDPTVKHHREVGKINECCECAIEVVQKYVGRRDGGKHGGIEIFRENIETVQSVINAECRGGFYPKIAISSPVFEQMREEK